MSEILNVKVKYFDQNLPKIEKIKKGDWIDLVCAEDILLSAGDIKLIPLGVAMEIPRCYEAHVLPRSSTFKNFGILQTNAMGIIDSSYSGPNDQWFMPVYATRDIKIEKYSRICQFRLIKNMDPINFIESDLEDNIDRGGHGSTGIK